MNDSAVSSCKKPEPGQYQEGKTIMMPSDQQSSEQRLKRQDDTNSLYCKLFADEVPENICALRKRELNGRGEFTCVGCSWATS
jgi:hypothetical protein